MNCTRVREILPLYAENDLDRPELDGVARHLDDCAECRARLELDRELATALATLPSRREDARVRNAHDRTWNAIQRHSSTRRLRPTVQLFRRVVSTSLGLIAVVLLAFLLLTLGKPVLDQGRAASTAVSVPPSRLLLVDAGAADGHLGVRPVDPTTLADLPGYASLNFGHDYWSALSPDGKTLAAMVHPINAAQSQVVLHLVDVTSGREVVPGVTIDDYVEALTFGPAGRSLYWISPVFHEPVQSWPDGRTLYRYDLARGTLDAVASLPAAFVPWAARAVPNGTLAIYGIPTNAGNLATDAPHLLLLSLASGQITANLRLDGIKAGQYLETDPTTGQPSDRMYWPGLAWDVARQRLYVASAETDRIVVVNLASGRIIRQGDVHPAASLLDRLLRWLTPPAEAKGGPSTMGVAELSPDGQRLYLARTSEAQTWSSSGLEMVNTGDLSLVERVDLPVSDLALSPNGQRLLLRLWWPEASGSPAHQALAIFDAQQLRELGRIAVDSPFELLGFLSDGREAYVGRDVQRTDRTWEWRISVVDVAARRIVAERGFSVNGVPAFVSYVGIWRNGSWLQGP